MQIDITQIHDFFSPSREIEDPDQFVGRPEELGDGIEALVNPGGFLAIYGLRGVGKSSIARQIKRIAEGDETLPKRLGYDHLLPKKHFNFMVHYFQCDRFIQDVPDLTKRILFGDEDNPSLFSLTVAGNKKLAEFKRTVDAHGSAGFFGARVGGRGSESSTYAPYVSDDEIQQFRQLLGTVRKDNQEKSGLLILIDEFDILNNKTGFASLVKACSSEFVKFGVIGIASSIAELNFDHGSIGRQIDLIHVPLMPTHELKKIIDRAEWLSGGKVGFEDEATEKIVTQSAGFPYFVHLLGKEALLRVLRQDRRIVTKKDVDAVFARVSSGRLRTVYEDLYCSVVNGSHNFEIMLKLLAEDDEDDMSFGSVVATAESFDIENPLTVIELLMSRESRHPVLTPSRSGYFRFIDPVFKVYAKMRQWES